MRTLFIVPDMFLTEGGIARILRVYLKAACDLATPGDSVRYVALNESAEAAARAQAYAGGRLVGVDCCEKSKMFFLLTVLWRGRKVDRLICGHLHHLILARFAAVMHPGLKYYLIAHGIEVWRPYSIMERAALRDAFRIFCVSEYTRRQMLRFDPGLDPARLLVVPNTFDPSFELSASDSRLPSPSGHPRILVVSRLVASDPYKGVDTMIEAMPLIRRQFPLAELRIVGGGDDRRRLEELVRSLGLDAVVHFCGMIDDAALRKEYAACDLFALPSRKEGFGLVYLEAMTYGKPCLAARAGGAPEVVTRDVGALVEYGNTHEIATAVADLIRHPRSREAMSAHAAKFSFPVFKKTLSKALGEPTAA